MTPRRRRVASAHLGAAPRVGYSHAAAVVPFLMSFLLSPLTVPHP